MSKDNNGKPLFTPALLGSKNNPIKKLLVPSDCTFTLSTPVYIEGYDMGVGSSINCIGNGKLILLLNDNNTQSEVELVGSGGHLGC